MERFSKSIRGFANNVIQAQLFTDGSCWPNPGAFGSFSYIINFRDGQSSVKHAEASTENLTTNNRMELMGVISALRTLKEPMVLELVTDSEYVGKGICNGMSGWAKRDFLNKNGDLWRELYHLCSFHHVYVTCIKGHAGQPENELCDKMADEAANNKRKLSNVKI